MNKVSQPRFTKRTKLSYGFLSVTLWRKPQRVITANTRIYERMSDLVKFDSLGNPTTTDHREDLAKRIKTIRDAVALYRDEVEFQGREYSSAELQRVIDMTHDWKLGNEEFQLEVDEKFIRKLDKKLQREMLDEFHKVFGEMGAEELQRVVDKKREELENEE